MTDVRLPRISRCAGVVALAAMLSVAAREPGHGAGTPGRAPFGERIAGADPNGDSWFRIGDLMNHDIREGEIFGLLGPNGAAARTTSRVFPTACARG
jgi:hypothetical protein